jgi:hypothetical protein
MADAKVAVLNVVPVDRTGAPQKNVIAYIEDLLVRARSGEVQSIITAWVQANGKPAHGMMWGERPQDYYLMGTALLFAEHEFVSDAESVALAKAEQEPEPEPA